jgi:multidrug efflux pump subunit AcrB
MNRPLGIAGRIAQGSVNSKLTPLLVLAALMLGAFAIVKTPRSEDPQIVVPMLDVMVAMPGASPNEVERRVSSPMERLLRQMPGVKYVYAISRPGMSLITVRFKVNYDQEKAVVQTYNKLYSNLNIIPPGVSRPIIKVRSIDNVPMLALTLWGPKYGPYRLRQVADELKDTIKQTDNVSQVTVIGGEPRAVRVVLENARLAAYGITAAEVVSRLQAANVKDQVGSFADKNREFLVDAGRFFTKADGLQQVVVAVKNGQPVYLRDVAQKIVDGPADRTNYVLYANAAGAKPEAGVQQGVDYPAVTISIAKLKDTNATIVANNVLKKVHDMRGTVVPEDLNITVTRNYGRTANDKSNELLEHLFLAISSVTLLIAFALGWRESGVVLLAIPVTLAFTLAIFYFYGYTLNRVTLFALIFSIGILVDDAIVVVENIVRHFRLPESRGRSLSEVAVEAVGEVGNPTILATFAVIASILPMAFVGGLMGPYMRPIPVGAASAMMVSLLVAFIISPWASLRLLGHSVEETGATKNDADNWLTLQYRRLIAPMIEKASLRYMFLGFVVLLLLLAILLVPLTLVKVKMLPFDNASDFQIIVSMNEGRTLEETTTLAQAMGAYLAQQPEVSNYQIYAGASAPYNFNGLVRHYFLRDQPNQADIQVNLRPKNERSQSSHEIAERLRPQLVKIATKFDARVEVSENPPGPPVMQTLVAEVYGPNLNGQIDVARQIKKIFSQTSGVVDVNWFVEYPQSGYDIDVDLAKAALVGVSAQQVTQTLAIGLHGMNAGLLHAATADEDVPINVRLRREDRSSIEQLQNLKLPTSSGRQVSLAEVTTVRKTTLQQAIYQKDLRRVVYVTGDVAGAEASPVYAILKMNKSLDKLRLPQGYILGRYNSTMPTSIARYSMKWGGEWAITIQVFRDLGVAFAGALLLMYVLIVGWFRSFFTPLIIMAPIPLTLIGILPAHALMGAFFTATSMIGFIAGAGIVVRNSIILVDFTNQRREEGMTLEEAVIDAGAIRMRPILLTAAAVVVSAGAIITDPVFQGMAISLMAGGLASTLLTLVAIPVLYYIFEKRKSQHKSIANGN